MTLREVLDLKMKQGRLRPCDFASTLNKKRAAVSRVLNRNVDSIRFGTLRQYFSVVGLELDLEKFINPN
jgi:hypothetical protein